MILCVAPSPAWDVTYGVERFDVHATNRVRTVSARAGGKAVNVARVLHALGEGVTTVAPVGGPTGDLFTADLAAEGIPLSAVPSGDNLRRTVAIVCREAGDATVVNEPCSIDDWTAFEARAESLTPHASIVVVAGSIPTGAPDDAVGRLIRICRRAHVPVVVDTSGPALLSALAESPTLVKPNLAELSAATDVTDPRAAARILSVSSGSAVAITLGADGIVLAADGQVWHGSIERELRGNPTGAGDAAMAAFARGIATCATWPDILRDAVALSASSVLAPHAGEINDGQYRSLSRQIVIEPLGPGA